MKTPLLLSILSFALPALAQDSYRQVLRNRITATRIPTMDRGTVRKKLRTLTYQELKNFDLIRVKAPIVGVKQFETLVIGGGKATTPELKFAAGKGYVRFMPGDWLRILSVTRKDVAEMELAGTQLEISSFSADAQVFTFLALKMSPDFKRSELFVMNALAEPTDAIEEFEVFHRDVLSGGTETSIKELRPGDVVMSASQMHVGPRGHTFPANTPLLVESVTSAKQPWRFVWKYELKLRNIDCPSEIERTKCRGTYAEEYLRRPLVFMKRIHLR